MTAVRAMRAFATERRVAINGCIVVSMLYIEYGKNDRPRFTKDVCRAVVATLRGFNEDSGVCLTACWAVVKLVRSSPALCAPALLEMNVESALDACAQNENKRRAQITVVLGIIVLTPAALIAEGCCVVS